jgi:hypothetical protein
MRRLLPQYFLILPAPFVKGPGYESEGESLLGHADRLVLLSVAEHGIELSPLKENDFRNVDSAPSARKLVLGLSKAGQDPQ